MADIQEFADQASRLFGCFQDTLRFNANLYRQQGGLPTSREAASEFIKAAYYASLIPDEGRYPNSCLMCYRSDQEFYFQTVFNESLEASAEEIAKLSHAIDSRSHIACVGSTDQITLRGFRVNMPYNQREYGYLSGRIANPLKIRITGPGNIEVSCTGGAVVFRGGQISEESPLTFSTSMERLAARITEELRKTREDLVESLDDIFNDLMREIVRLEHGGMVIFSQTPDTKHFSSLRGTTCDFFHSALVDYWDSARELVSIAGGVDKLLTTNDRAHLMPYMLKVARSTDQVENCIPAIANLSGMDGAIIFTYDCKVAAFNAIIDRQNASESEAKLIRADGTAIDYRETFAQRGSRHQSALLYAKSVRDSFVFVISQDGSISAFHNPGDGSVVCEFGLRPME